MHQDIRLTIRQMRWLLAAGSVLGLTAGFLLFVLATQTDRYFAWTINPPVTAAFLGAAYWASAVLVLLGSRERIWARARIAVPGTLVFAVLTLIATVLHLDRFHLQQPDPTASVAAWLWLAVYALLWLAVVILLLLQLRAAGSDPPRGAPLPSWLRVLLAVQGTAMLLIGVGLFVAPEAIAPGWPWMLTPLTAQAIGAWIVASSVVMVETIWENDWLRIGAAAWSFAVAGVLELVALARYLDSINWQQPSSWIYVVGAASVLLVGFYTAWGVRSVAGAAAKV